MKDGNWGLKIIWKKNQSSMKNILKIWSFENYLKIEVLTIKFEKLEFWKLNLKIKFEKLEFWKLNLKNWNFEN